MLDPKVIEQLVKDQISTMVNDQVMEIFSSSEWLDPIEQRIIQYTQDRILVKFANATAMPEIVDAVKQGITELFASGKIPDLAQYVNKESITHSVNLAVTKTIQANVAELAQDPQWMERVEQLINQAVVQQTIATIGSVDINTIIHDRVDANIDRFQEKLRDNFSSTGMVDQSTKNQMTLTDEETVFENTLIAQDLTIANSACIQNLVVTGSINTDNYAWDSLSADIAEKTFAKITDAWQQDLVQQVAESIKNQGIEFDRVTVGGELLVNGDRLANTIKETSIQSTGPLRSLQVLGGTSLNETLNVNRKRVGLNTEEPEMALSIWDEEVAINIGKHKEKTAYIGTSRTQGIAFGTNRTAHIEITADGLTQIKKLQVGVHRISHDTQVPGYSGTKGDIVFNSNLGADRVFAWVCLGAFKWQPLKSAT
jgi:hypothetical protein